MPEEAERSLQQLLENEDVLLDAVADGARTGIFEVKESEGLYYRRNISPNIDSIVLRGEVAKRIKEDEEAKERKDENYRKEKGTSAD